MTSKNTPPHLPTAHLTRGPTPDSRPPSGGHRRFQRWSSARPSRPLRRPGCFDPMKKWSYQVFRMAKISCLRKHVSYYETGKSMTWKDPKKSLPSISSINVTFSYPLPADGTTLSTTDQRPCCPPELMKTLRVAQRCQPLQVGRAAMECFLRDQRISQSPGPGKHSTKSQKHRQSQFLPFLEAFRNEPGWLAYRQVAFK